GILAPDDRAELNAMPKSVLGHNIKNVHLLQAIEFPGNKAGFFAQLSHRGIDGSFAAFTCAVDDLPCAAHEIVGMSADLEELVPVAALVGANDVTVHHVVADLNRGH